MSDRPTLTRRDALFGFLRRPAPPEPEAAKVAVIQGRFCLAYRNLDCAVCVERCPEPQAIVREHHLPRVVAEACTGCGICQDVCPAPRNAVLLVVAPTGAVERSA